ncbi:phosphotransferase [Pontibacter rugosus]|uniref:Phosphotransferase n=1 Tax=Pontibacter rugosus TaxID=1745966 RepID=A0ABW3SL79_9BACT
MNIFPVIDSTLSAKHLGVWVAEKYALAAETTCRLFRTNMNHTYLVTASGKKYVLRVYSHNKRTATEIAEEIRLLNLLKDSDIDVSYPLPDKDGTYMQLINAPEGERAAVLFSFGEGGKVRNLTEELSYAIGAMMAKIHQRALHEQLNRTKYSIHHLAELPYQHMKAFFSESLEEMKFVKAAGTLLNSVFDKDTAARIRAGVVHLDIWYDNMSITDNGRITLFDFDNAGNGWCVLDIGYFCIQLFYVEQDKAVYEQKLENFLQGYQQLASVSEDELKLIPYAGLAIWIYYLGVQAERFDNFSNIFYTENYLKMYLGKVKQWLNYHAIEV